MTLAAGARVGPYEIAGLIGAGGMGEVYRARDTKLNRDVALKVLPDLFAADPDRLARFKREAQVLASLNHPNIAAIYGLEEDHGVRALVLELVEGATLSERIAEDPIRVDEALAIARQIADALEAAHEHGVIHRDLKPANIKVRQDGAVKVLDFGLAKALDRAPRVGDASQSPTITSPAQTQMGVMLGTAAYMSPEQARGKDIDRRADIWAFGCVLYEMLTGKRPFESSDSSDVLAKIIEREPDFSALPANTPRPIRRLVRRCLEKDRNERIPHIAIARIEITDALRTVPEDGAEASRVETAKRWRWVFPASLAAVVVGTIVGAAVWNLKPDAFRSVTRFADTLPTGDWPRGIASPLLAISPDGRSVVYATGQELRFRPLDELHSTPIPGTAGGFGPFFSPDGEWVAFFAENKLKKVSLRERRVVTICDAPLPRGGSWGSDDTIIFAPTRVLGLSRVAAAGGSPEAVTKRDDATREGGHAWPDILPGGEAVLFTVEGVEGAATGEALTVTQALRTGERKIVLRGASGARYVPTGHLVYANHGNLFAVRFDPVRLEVVGAPELVVEGVLHHAEDDVAQFSVSLTGTLIYLPGGFRAAPRRRLVWVNRKGSVVAAVTEDRRAYSLPRLSPDGTRIAVERDGDVWSLDLSRDTWNRLTFDGGFFPLWMPTGDGVVYQSSRDGPANLYKKRLIGGELVERLTTSERIQTPTSWSRNGDLIFIEVDPTYAREIWLLERTGGHGARKLIGSPADETAPRLSPDGRWLAYSSNQINSGEIFVQPFPGLDQKWQISTNGGTDPVWARDGRELFYRNGDTMMVVAVDIERGRFTWHPPRALFQGRFEASPLSMPNYDVALDGQRFLMIEPGEEDRPPSELDIVLNWSEELEARVPRK